MELEKWAIRGNPSELCGPIKGFKFHFMQVRKVQKGFKYGLTRFDVCFKKNCPEH